MEKNRLYYEDAYCRRFTARVLECRQEDERWAVRLDRSAFYPEGGGQAGDTGTLGGVTVMDCQEREESVWHVCAGPLAVGSEVEGEIDFALRRERMEQHTGEHMVSGLIHARFGLDNVGFHMGAAVTAIDFNGELSWDQVQQIQHEANAFIRQDLPVEELWPEPEELAALPYRSKKELTGTVRLIDIPGVDRCACCGTHLRRTGEVGLILITGLQKLRGGCRMELLCGERAYRHICAVNGQNRATSQLLSARAEETHGAVKRLQEELEAVKYRTVGWEERCFALRAETVAGRGDVLLWERELTTDGLRRCCDRVMRRCGGVCAVFSGSDETGWRYALGTADGEIASAVREMNAALRGRGGGKGGLAQGSVQAKEAEIRDYFAGFFCPETENAGKESK